MIVAKDKTFVTFLKVISDWVLARFKDANIVFNEVDYKILKQEKFKQYEECKGKRDRLSNKIDFLEERQSDLDERYKKAFSECVNCFQMPPESKATAVAAAESKASAEANAAAETKSAAAAAEKESFHTRKLLQQLYR